MPAPGAPTDLTITPIIQNSGAITLDWDHTGTNLDRFQILFKRADADAYEKLVVAPKADFGAGPYTLDTATGMDFRWKVVALNSTGDRSSTNPTALYSTPLDGLWLLPLHRRGVLAEANVAYIRADSPSEDHERTFGEFDTPFGEEQFTQAGKLHLRKGSIEGALLDRNNQAPAEWKDRLRRLIKNQSRYERVMLATRRDFFPVELTEGFSADPHPQISYAWTVSVPYRELKR